MLPMQTLKTHPEEGGENKGKGKESKANPPKRKVDDHGVAFSSSRRTTDRLLPALRDNQEMQEIRAVEK
jgi:hypothetical protein